MEVIRTFKETSRNKRKAAMTKLALAVKTMTNFKGGEVKRQINKDLRETFKTQISTYELNKARNRQDYKGV